MSGLNSTRGLLALASIVEAGTGVLLIFAPALVVRLLVGLDVSTVGAILGRCFGIALLSLALACHPGRSPDTAPPAYRGMLAYNALIALYLGYVGAFGHQAGVLLWPAALLHAILAGLLLWTHRVERG